MRSLGIIQIIFLFLLPALVGLNISVGNYGTAAFVFCCFLFNVLVYIRT